MKNIFLFVLLLGIFLPLQAGEKEEIQKWIASFSNASQRVRLKASVNLAKKGKSALPFLIQALSHSRWVVRYYAAITLGKMGPEAKKAIPALTDRLYDSDLRVRCHAALALASQGERAQSAIPSLVKGIKDTDWRIRCYFAYSLGKLKEKSPVVLSALESALGDSSVAVQQTALKALGELRARKSIPALLKIYGKSPPSFQKSILQVLIQLKSKKAIYLLLKVFSGEKREQKAFAKAKLIEMGPLTCTALQKVIAKKKYSPSLKIAALEILGFFPRPTRATLQSILTALSNSNIDIRSGAKRTLNQIGPKAIPFLLVNWSRSKGDTRENIRRILGEWDQSALSHIVKLSVSQPSLRKPGSLYLKSLGTKILPLLLKNLRHKDAKYRRFAVSQLGQLSTVSPLVFFALKKSIKDPNGQVREEASRSLKRLKSLFSPTFQSKIEALLKPKKPKKPKVPTKPKVSKKSPEKPIKEDGEDSE